MPGFMIHLAEAKMIMNYMTKKPEKTWCYEFMMGNLLPDTRLGGEKKISHFWPEGCDQYIAKAPELDSFLNKYGHRLEEPVILGYYAHLYLDERYVNAYWPMIIEFRDADGKKEARKAQICDVTLKRSGKIIPFNAFFTAENYYGDYTRSNHWLIEKYHIEPLEFRLLENIDMDEVCAKDLEHVLDELKHMCKNGHIGDEKSMAVLDLELLDAFVQKTAKEFWDEVKQVLHK